jgi:hypothetical protein
MSVDSEICRAIGERKLISFLYKDDIRTVEPHMVAYSKKGKLVLSAWFLRGGSESNEGPGWRNYVVEDISQVRVLEAGFSAPRPGYQPGGGNSFHRIQCAL